MCSVAETGSEDAGKPEHDNGTSAGGETEKTLDDNVEN